jgi:hypothetical protein
VTDKTVLNFCVALNNVESHLLARLANEPHCSEDLVSNLSELHAASSKITSADPDVEINLGNILDAGTLQMARKKWNQNAIDGTYFLSVALYQKLKNHYSILQCCAVSLLHLRLGSHNFGGTNAF